MPWVIPGLALAVAVPLALSHRPAESRVQAGPNARPGNSSGPAGTRVEIVYPRKEGLERVSRQPGTVRAFEHADLYAKVSGYLETLAVDIGDEVKAGQTLAVLRVPELQQAVARSRAALEQAESRARQAEARIRTARAAVSVAEAGVPQARAELEQQVAKRTYRRKEFDRIADLARRHAVESKLVDEQEDQYHATIGAEHAAEAGLQTARAGLEEARAKVEQATADHEAALAEVDVAKADVAAAQVMLDYTRILAPYDGIITARGYHRGDFIRSAADGSTPALLSIARVDLMRVVVQLPDRDVPFVDRGDPATYRIQALGNREFRGKVARFAAKEDEQTRTMRTEIDLPNPDGMLRDGMYGGVEIVLEPASSQLSVPSSALVEHADERGAIFVVRDGKAHRVEVKVGRDNGIESEILDGLDEDDEVIVRAMGSLSEGVAVRAEAPRTAATGGH